MDIIRGGGRKLHQTPDAKQALFSCIGFNAMRTLVLVPLGILIAGAGGVGLCIVAGWDPHLLQLSLAAVGCLGASIAGAAPMALVRHASQYAVTQAALVGSIVYLFGVVMFAGVVMLTAAGGGLSIAMVLWLVVFYCVTLAALVAFYVRAVRNAPPASLLTHAVK
jgi:hypothetical protein